MTAVEIRLECLRLAHRHDLQQETIVERAKAYEAYVSGNAQQAAQSPRGKTGNRDPFK